MIEFNKKETKTLHLKGVFFGDAGSGKSHIARDFIKKSVKQTGNNKAILIDTENGWEWLKRDIENIDIIETNIDWSDKNIDIVDLFQSLHAETNKNPVACVVIDSATRIGELLYSNALIEVNNLKAERARRYNKQFYPQTELEYQDWSFFNEKSDIIVNLIRKMQCHVVLCGRATSENAMDVNKKVVEATERTVTGWKKISFEFDFSCLLKPSIDLTKKDNFKNFETYVIKSRFADDGKILGNNDFLSSWFSCFEKFDYEVLKEKIILADTKEAFLEVKKLALAYKNQMNEEQQTEMRRLITNKEKAINEMN